jgi:Retrotransposon gag protein
VRSFTYRNTVSEVAVCLAGDGRFPSLRRRLLRLLNDAPIFAEDARVLMAYGFKEAASEKFEEVLAKHDDASSEQLWTLLETKLFSAHQIAATRTAFSNADMGTHESVKSYSLRLKKLARALPEGRTEEVLHQRFITGLLPHMRKDAALVSGSYDQIVSKMAGLEAFRPEGSSSRCARARRRWSSPTMGRGVDEGEGTFAEHIEAVSAMNEPLSTPPVGFKPGAPVEPRLRKVQCWRCNQLGHMAHGSSPREWPRASTPKTKRAAGNGGR